MKVNRWMAIWVGWLLLWSTVLPVRAQGEIIVDANQARLNFPRNIIFTLKVHSSAVIDEVQVVYHTNARSCLNSTGHKAVEIHKGVALTAEWIWDLASADNLPPGAVVTWQWQIHDSDGNTLLTPEQKITIDDPDYVWQTTQSAGISVFWSEGDTIFGQQVLNTAAASLARLIKETGIPQPQAVRLIVYPSSQELRGATMHLPGWAGGVAFPEYSTVMIGLAPEDKDFINDIVPHELAHLVIDQRIDNCVGNTLPTWLSEGLATFGEGPTSTEDTDLVKSALQRGQAPALSTLNAGFAPESDRAAISYAESGMVVTFMVKTYGPKKLDEFLEQIKQGMVADKALTTVYGLDTDGIDQAWRDFMGYANAASTSVAASPTAKVQRTAVPTLALLSAASATQRPSATWLPTSTSSPTSTEAPAPLTPTATSSPTAAAEASQPDFPVWGWVLIGMSVLILAAFSAVRLLHKN